MQQGADRPATHTDTYVRHYRGTQSQFARLVQLFRNCTGVMSKVKMHVKERERTHRRRRHKLVSRAQEYHYFPGRVMHGHYGLFKLPTRAPSRAAHASV